ncbi:MAG: lytic transglycosylase domain-containing protein [Myxococcota bacterium]
MARFLLRTSGLGLAGLAALALAGEARADLFKCTRGRDVWVTNYRAPGASCSRIDIATDPPRPKSAPSDSGASAGSGSAGGSDIAAFDKPAPRRERFAPIAASNERFSGDEPDGREGREQLYAAYFDEAAEVYDLPEPFLRAVARVESNFRYKAKSSAGAMGLMQLMPGTARDMGVADVWDPRSNVLGGARLLRVLADRFGGDMVKVLAAYHAGGGAVADADGIPYEATETYVRTVLDYYYQYKALGGTVEQ